MTRCPEFYEKFEKDGNFCGLSTSAISQIKAYRELIDKIVKTGIDKAVAYTNFPEKASREITSVKDDETRTKALNYVVSSLKAGKPVTGPELKSQIKEWLGAGSCTVEKHADIPGHVSKKFTLVNSPTEQKPDPAPIQDTPVQPSLAAQVTGTIPPEPPVHRPPPCLGGGGCQKGKFRSDKVRGNVCDAIGAPINQLPGNICPYDAKLERQAPAAASKPLQDRTLTITFPPEEWETLKNVQRAGEADGFEAAVHVIIQRAGVRDVNPPVGTRHTGESPICKICKSGKQEPFCIGCERLLEHDAAIREDERNQVVEAALNISDNTAFYGTSDWLGFKEKISALRATTPVRGNRTEPEKKDGE